MEDVKGVIKALMKNEEKLTHLDVQYLMGKHGSNLSQKEYQAKRQKLRAEYEKIKRRSKK